MESYSGAGCIGVLLAAVVLLAVASVFGERCRESAPEPVPLSVGRAPLTSEPPPATSVPPSAPARAEAVIPPARTAVDNGRLGYALTDALRATTDLCVAARDCHVLNDRYGRGVALERFLAALRRRIAAAEEVKEALRATDDDATLCLAMLLREHTDSAAADAQLTRALERLTYAQHDSQKREGVAAVADAGLRVCEAERRLYGAMQRCLE